MFPHSPELDDTLRLATVLAEIGEVFDAEALVVEVLDRRPDDLTALDVFAKIKHIRGELSVAVACWARVHSRSPQNEAALMHLSSMLQLARDPERGAGEFLALGPFQLWRKPAAHLELEEAFRLFLSRRPDEAKAKCERLASRFRGKESDLYKLAVLARAWIAELSGDLAEACEVLEALGLERGYETDTDRILALARVYERIGTTEALGKAVHVCEYLRRNIDRFSILGRLASLYEALGKERKARECRALFLAGFRQRMHRPCLRDVTAAAAGHYLPLRKLREVPRHGPAPADDAPRRERAIERALEGDTAGARALLSPPEGPLDLRYLADLAEIEGDGLGAVGHLLESLADDENDPRVLVRLLVETGGEAREAATGFFRSQPDEVERARLVLERAVEGAPLRPSLWEALAVLHGIAGNGDRREACAGRAAVLREAAGRKKKAVGRALAAAVYHFVGKSKGIVHEVWASRRPAPAGRGGQLDEILGNLTPEMERNVRNTFLSIREYALSKFPHRTTDLMSFNYSYKVTKEDEPSGGLSAGVPTALAFLSVFLDRPLPQDVASSGALVADAHDVLVVKGIGEPEHKVRGAYNRNLRMLVLPEANRAELTRSPLVPGEVVDEVVRFAADFDRVAGLVFGEEIWSP